MRADGKSLRDIAEALNVSVPTAKTYWRSGLALLLEETKEQVGEQRAVMLARLEELISKWSVMANLPHVEGADRAAAIVIRAMEGQARLLGLDKVDPNVKPAVEMEMGEALKSKAAKDALRRIGRRRFFDYTAPGPASPQGEFLDESGMAKAIRRCGNGV